MNSWLICFAMLTGKKGNQTVEEAFTSFAEILTFENVGNLTYLHAAVTETMRLYPPVPMASSQSPNSHIPNVLRTQ
jgi:cytochrome P450